jgi:hypothetical protein
VDGLARKAEVARDRGERRAVGKRVRDLAALERVQLAPKLAELAQRGSGRGGARGLGREQGESSRLAFDVIVNARRREESGLTRLLLGFGLLLLEL